MPPPLSDARRVDSVRARAAMPIRTALVVALLALPGEARASEQQTSPSEPAAAPAQAETQAIPLPQIIERAEQTSRSLVGIESSLPPVEALTKIEAALPGVQERIETQSRIATSLLESTPSLEQLEELERRWKAFTRELEGPRHLLRERAGRIDGGLLELDQERDLWRRTEEEARAAEAPEALLGRITGVQETIRGARERLLSRATRVLTLQSHVDGLHQRVAAELARVNQSWDLAAGDILRPGSEPIWSRDLYARIGASFVPRLRSEVSATLDEIRAFGRARAPTMALHAALLGALATILWGARRRVRRRTEQEDGLASVAALFERPVSMALLVSILASLWLYPDRPRAVEQLLGAAALVPAVLILRRLVDRPVFPFLDALLVFFFADRVRELFAPVPTLARGLFLLEMLGVVIVLVTLMRPARIRRIPPALARSRFLRVAAFSGRLGIGVAVAAIVADAFGYSVLAKLLGNAMLRSAYAALVLYAAVRVVDGLAVVALRVAPLRLLGMVQRHRALLRRRTRRILNWAAVVGWAAATLGFLKIDDDVWAAAGRLLSGRISIGELSMSLGDVAAFLITIWAAFQVSRFVRFALEEDVYPRMRFPKGAPYAVSALTHYTVIFLGFLLAIVATGIDLTRFAILAGAFGVGLGFGLQNVVNNFVSGLILLTERPVEVGDTIERGEMFGSVQRIGIRSSTVRTWEGAEVIVPNAELISERVINWTHSDRLRRLDIPVGVAYGSDPRKVIAVLLEAIKGHAGVLSTPEPNVLFRGFGDSSLDFEIRAWTDRFDSYLAVRSDLCVAAVEALREAGLEIPFPQRDVHIRSVVEARATAPELPENPGPREGLRSPSPEPGPARPRE